MIDVEVTDINFREAKVRFGTGSSSITMTITNPLGKPVLPKDVQLSDSLMVRLTALVNGAAKAIPRLNRSPATLLPDTDT